MRNIAIIPARGGSKRIPRKNIKHFLDKPIIAYSIQAALSSKLFDEVMVSTDDEEIAAIASKYGAKVPFFRSADNAGDFATTADVIKEVITCYKDIGQHFDFTCCIYPTAPLIRPDTLLKSYDLLVQNSYQTVFPVVMFSFPIWRALNIENGKAKMYWPENRSKRSQDLPKAWHDAGQFYWLNTAGFMNDPVLYSSNSGVIELSDLEVQDIDNLVDWQLAELKARLL